MKQLIKRLFSGTCLWFTLLAVGLMLIRLIAEGSGDGIIEIPRFLLLLPCGLFLAAAGTIYRNTALAGWARLLLHYLFCMLAFFLFLWLPAGGRTAVKNLLAILFFTLIYAAVFAVVLLTRKRIRGIREED